MENKELLDKMLSEASPMEMGPGKYLMFEADDEDEVVILDVKDIKEISWVNLYPSSSEGYYTYEFNVGEDVFYYPTGTISLLEIKEP
jgi:hypothetical protein